MTSDILRGLLHQLATLRTSKPSLSEKEANLYLYRAAYFDGYLAALQDQGLITWGEWVRLLELRANLGSRIGDPFPSCANAGPVMPVSVRMERAKKPQMVEPAHEPVELPAADPRPRLHLLCLLEPHLGGAGVRPSPVATMHPVPPYAGVHGRWRLGPGRRRMADGFVYVPCGAWLHLREAHAAPAAPEVLARCVRQRSACAFRADTRAVRGLTT